MIKFNESNRIMIKLLLHIIRQDLDDPIIHDEEIFRGDFDQW